MENVCGSERKVCVQCLWRVCVRVKGEHTEVCVSMRVQGKKSTWEKIREHKKMQHVCSLKL